VQTDLHAAAAVARQFGRFAAVGVTNTLLSALVYAALLDARVPYLPAAGVGFAAGAVNGYVLNSRWTFGTGDSTRSRLRYVAVQLAGLAASSLLLWLLVGQAGLGRAIGYLLTLAAVTAGMFAANRGWTFAVPQLPAPSQVWHRSS
jgi:putative flippase GtrA